MKKASTSESTFKPIITVEEKAWTRKIQKLESDPLIDNERFCNSTYNNMNASMQHNIRDNLTTERPGGARKKTFDTIQI